MASPISSRLNDPEQICGLDFLRLVVQALQQDLRRVRADGCEPSVHRGKGLLSAQLVVREQLLKCRVVLEDRDPALADSGLKRDLHLRELTVSQHHCDLVVCRSELLQAWPVLPRLRRCEFRKIFLAEHPTLADEDRVAPPAPGDPSESQFLLQLQQVFRHDLFLFDGTPVVPYFCGRGNGPPDIPSAEEYDCAERRLAACC
jgi:hypothetical protein